MPPIFGTPQESIGRIMSFRKFVRQSRRSLRGPLGWIFILGVLLLCVGHYCRFDPATYLKAKGVPIMIADFFHPRPLLEPWRWDDDVGFKHGSNDIHKRSKFHLLIPNKEKPNRKICKTILTAAILNYPPPTLITGADSRSELTRSVFDYLHGKEVADEDLVIVVEEDMWFQLPAEVTINRFFHGIRDSNILLIEKYGFYAEDPKKSPKFTQKVLFGAQKLCDPNTAEDPACRYAPKSPLPSDIYGDDTDEQPKHSRPRFLHAPVIMGRAADLRPIYQAACEALENFPKGHLGNQYVFAQIFGEQEFQRAAQIKSNNKASATNKAETSGKLLESTHDLPFAKNHTLTTTVDKNYEFGIGLDYASSIFQVMDKSEADVHFVSFDHKSFIQSPSKRSKDKFKDPIHLPLDLNATAPPFSQHKVNEENPNPPILPELDYLPYWKNWTDVKLATNIVVPGGVVPATLNFHGNEKLMDEWWLKMWFWNSSRALLRQVHRSPIGHIASEAASDGGHNWWDLRGGKGGVWTDRGEWLDWTDVCGAYHEAVFGDGKGEYGKESATSHQQPVYSRTGILLSGKPAPGQKGPKPGQVRTWHLPAHVEEEEIYGEDNGEEVPETIRKIYQEEENDGDE